MPTHDKLRDDLLAQFTAALSAYEAEHDELYRRITQLEMTKSDLIDRNDWALNKHVELKSSLSKVEGERDEWRTQAERYRGHTGPGLRVENTQPPIVIDPIPPMPGPLGGHLKTHNYPDTLPNMSKEQREARNAETAEIIRGQQARSSLYGEMLDALKKGYETDSGYRFVGKHLHSLIQRAEEARA